MDWYYVSDGQQRGPVTDAELDELLRVGTINPATLVWRSGLVDWQPLQSLRPELATPVPPPLAARGPQGNAVCAECRQVFSQEDMVRLNQSWICAGCKPLFLQRLAEGAAPAWIGAIWRSGRQMVTRPDTALPDNCIRCNAPANGFRLKRTLYWHSPYFYLLILISILIYLIVILCVRKKAVLHVGLCEQHRKQRTAFIAGAWLGVLGGAALCIAGAYANSSAGLIVSGLLVAVVAAIVGAVRTAVISAAKIEGELVWVKGAGPAFLANLPEWTGS